jgi:hypothetical protein
VRNSGRLKILLTGRAISEGAKRIRSLWFQNATIRDGALALFIAEEALKKTDEVEARAFLNDLSSTVNALYNTGRMLPHTRQAA